MKPSIITVAALPQRARPTDPDTACPPQEETQTDYQQRLRKSMRTAINDARRRELRKAAKGKHCANVTITLDQVMAKLQAQNWRCAISGETFWGCGKQYGPTIPSIDRINPHGDYSPDNIRITLYGINSMRGCGTDADMYRIAEAIIRNRSAARHQ